MIIDQWCALKKYSFNPKWNTIIKEVWELRQNKSLTKGQHTISHGAFVNVDEYQSQEQKPFEQHKKFIDIHFLLQGEERMDIVFSDNIQKNPLQEEIYSPERDVIFYTALQQLDASILLTEDNFALVMPHEAHAPGMLVHNTKEKPWQEKKSCDIIKCVVKIPVELLFLNETSA